MEYLINVGVSLTQLLNALAGGYPDESTSARAWRMERQGKPAGRILRPLIDRLFFWQEGHCRRAYEAERARYHLPPILR